MSANKIAGYAMSEHSLNKKMRHAVVRLEIQRHPVESASGSSATVGADSCGLRS